ncbi:arsenate reductase ArsC [Micromonospora sp. 4G55]|uniref:arsenate reductase ArsC n=1 Tax=Micromonospora sp. 4G55 TaxID=2806102 RepID=UPI001A5E9A8F|nr:arsenate reductase ArsC [Micromonospora sp. 4G55]MBM0255940.1 arsenate reductase ArsC [Micromonospora sp. 4G55]
MTDTGTYLRGDLSVDQQLALRTAATRLAAEFDGTYGTERVQRLLHASYDQFATVDSVPNYLSGRSQMALGFFTRLAGDTAVAWSGDSEPGMEVNQAAVAAMAERGIDISEEFPKPWTDEVVRAADVVVTMGCGDACAVFPGTRYENWNLDDPAGLSLAEVRPIRDEIERRVRRLLDELHVPASR